jgi:hypothetical protein
MGGAAGRRLHLPSAVVSVVGGLHIATHTRAAGQDDAGTCLKLLGIAVVRRATLAAVRGSQRLSRRWMTFPPVRAASVGGSPSSMCRQSSVRIRR